jgi:hypothetical protein
VLYKCAALATDSIQSVTLPCHSLPRPRRPTSCSAVCSSLRHELSRCITNITKFFPPTTRPNSPKSFNIQTPSFFQRHDHLPSPDQVNAFRSLYLYISPHTYIGNIAKGPLYDRAINDEFHHEAGPLRICRLVHGSLSSSRARLEQRS